MQKGKIKVQTENIFPIIKKFLYSDHEIFLRELISNAVDATQKLKTLASTGHFKGELGDLTIHVSIDKKRGTLTVKDRGIGMTAEEVDKYINQIAFSSAEEFVKKFKTKTEAEQNAIIGHFGLGFYSSFMVSDKVELKSKTYKKGGPTKAVKWTCDGSPDYTLEEDDKADRGTEVTLFISKEEKEFLEDYKIRELLKKYCSFLPVPIQFGTKKEHVKVEGEKDKDGNDKYVEVEKPNIINNTDSTFDGIVAKLCNLTKIEYVNEKVDKAMSFVVKTTEFYLPLGDVVNVEQEIQKLEDELNYTRGFLAAVLKKLGNDRFVSGAPLAVVEKERQKQADAENKIKILEDQIAALKL
jgi:HSP90 family molecular chaperone